MENDFLTDIKVSKSVSYYHGRRPFAAIAAHFAAPIPTECVPNIRLSCERACPVSPLEPVVRWRQSTFSIIFFAIASK